MENLIYLLIGIVVLFFFVLAMRFIGAWMLRIDEVIDELKAIKNHLKEGNDHNSN